MKGTKKRVSFLLALLMLMPILTLKNVNASAKYMWPVMGSYGISRWNSSSHYGVDIYGSGGNTNPDIISTYAGTVTEVYNPCNCTGKTVAYYDSQGNYIGMVTCTTHRNTYGNMVKIANDDGTTSVYGHLKYNSICVSVGDRVYQGKKIGIMGDSGCSTGVHLHFEIRTGSTQSSCIDLKNIEFLPASSTPDTSNPTVLNGYVSDTSGSQFTIHCTLDDDVGVTKVWLNIYGPNGSDGYAVNTSNGEFSHTISTSKFGGAGTYSVHIYSFDAAGNQGALAINSIHAVNDSVAPVISDGYASDLSASKFTIHCNLTDNVGVTRVWLNIYGPGGSGGYSVNASNGAFSHTISTSDYGGSGKYTVHIYAFDSAGNQSAYAINSIEAVNDSSPPVISNAYASDISGSSFKIHCTLYDNHSVTRVWLNIYGPGGSNGYSVNASNGEFTHTIQTSEYGGAGKYTVHIYAFDEDGNQSGYSINNIEAVNDSTPPVISNGFASDISGDCFTIHCTLSDNVGVTRVWLNIYGPDGNNGYSVNASNGVFSHTISTSTYGGAGKYSVHIYAFDAEGNQTGYAINNIRVDNSLTIYYDCYCTSPTINTSQGFFFGDYNRICTTTYAHQDAWGTENVYYETLIKGELLSTDGLHDFADFGLTAPTGYTFAGWRSGDNGALLDETTRYTATDLTDEILSGQCDVWLSASFIPNNYTIIFNGNGATSGSMSDQSFTYNVAQNLNENAYLRVNTVTFEYNGATGENSWVAATQNATFYGWATSADGNPVYDDEQSVINLASDGTVTLYARWSNYVSIKLPTPTKTGYSFAGWSTKEDGTGSVYSGGTMLVLQDGTTLYAQWAVNPYYLDINGSLDNVYTTSIEGYGLADVYIDGICRASDVSDYYIQWDYGTPYEIRNIRAVTGHRYLGTSSTLTGTIGSEEQNTPITLRFATNSYGIVYDDSTGGDVLPAGHADVYYDNLQNKADRITSVTAEDYERVRPGYTFIGWNTEADGSGLTFAPGDTITAKELVDTLAEDPGDDSILKLYAQWESSFILGDADGDGEIGLKDVVQITRYLAGGWDVTVDLTIADVNKDGEVNLKDAVLLRRYLAGGWGVQLA